jgi:exonuclease SbcC
MIKLVSLDVDGFKNLKIHNLEFPPEGNILVTGRNESGKSSLFEAVFFALTSKLLVKKAGGFIDAIAFDKNAAVVDLIFKKDGIPARIKKQIYKTGTGTSVDIEFWKKYETGNERSISGNRSKIDPKIEEFLGFDDQILLNSSFVKQKGLEGFMEHSKQDRISILNKLLNMEKISTIRDLYKKELKNKEKIEQYYDMLLGIERYTFEIDKIKRSIETENGISESYEKNKEILFKIESLRSEFDRLTEESQRTAKIIEAESSEREKLEEIEKDLKKYQNLMTEHDSIKSKIQIEGKELENLNNTLNNQIKELNEHKNKIENFKQNGKRLEDCKKLLGQSEESIQDYETWKKKLEDCREIEQDIKRFLIQVQVYEVSIDKNKQECDLLESDIRLQINDNIKEFNSNVKKCHELEKELGFNSKKFDDATLKTGEYKDIEYKINELKFQLKEKEKDEIILGQKLEDYKKTQARITNSGTTLGMKEAELKVLQEKLTSLKNEEDMSRKLKELETLIISKALNTQKLTQINKKLKEDKEKLKPLKKISEKSEGTNQKLEKRSQFIKLLPICIVLIVLGIILSVFNLIFLIFTAIGGLLTIILWVREKGSTKEFSQYSKQYMVELEDRISENLNLRDNVEEVLKPLNNQEIGLKNELSSYTINKSYDEIVKEIELTQEKIIQTEEQIRSIKIVNLDGKNSIKEVDNSGIEERNQKLKSEIESVKYEIQKLENQTEDLRSDLTAKDPLIFNEPDKIKDNIRKLENNLSNMEKICERICAGFGIPYEFNEIKSLNLESILNTDIKNIRNNLESIESWSDWENFYPNFQKYPLIQKQLNTLKSKFEISLEENEILKDLVSKLQENRNKVNILREELPEKYRSNDQDFDQDFTGYTNERAKLEKEIKDLDAFLSENTIEDLDHNKNTFESKIKETDALKANTEEKIKGYNKDLNEIETSIPDQYQKSQEESMKELSTNFKQVNNRITSLKTEEEANWNNYLKDVQDFIKKFSIKYDSPKRESVNQRLQELSIEYKKYSNDLMGKIKKIYPSYSKDSAEESFKTLINEKHNRIGALKKDINEFNDYVRVFESNKKTLKLLNQSKVDGKDLSEKYENALFDRKIHETAIKLLEEGQGKIISKVLPRTEESLTKILPILTADRYKDAHITSDYQINVFDSKKGDYVERDLFSGGTNDQIALAIRLSFAMVTMPQNELNESFIFLDEPLGFFDDDRKNALIDFLTHGSIADQFAQRIVISNFLDIKKHFDFVIELENGLIINQYSTGTLDSKQIELLYETIEENVIVSIEHINIEEEDGYYEETVKVKNVTDIHFGNVQISIPEVNIMINPKNLYDVKPGLGKNVTIGFSQSILEGEDLSLDVVVKYQEKGLDVYKNQKISYVPQLK